MRQTLALVGLACAGAVLVAPAQAQTAAHSFDPAFMDKSVSPCQDFYKFACAAWIGNNPIPSDQTRWGRFNELANHNRDVLKQILEAAAADPTGENRKVGDYYASCTDEAGIEARGLDPLKPELARIGGLENKADLPVLLAHLHEIGVIGFFGFGSQADFKNAGQNIAAIEQGGLGLPDRDYYFKTDPKSVEQRDAYVGHVARMFALLGDAPDAAAAKAKAVLTVETALAKDALTRVRRRDPSAVYHKQTTAELAALAPSFDWVGYFRATGAPDFADLNVAEPEFVKAFGAALGILSLDDLKTYLSWHLVHHAAPMLPKAFDDENFAFYSQVLSGAKEQQPRWRRCVIATDRALGEALGKLYVAKAYPPEAEKRMGQLIADLKVAYAADIRNLPWMGAETKKRALEKLDAMARKIGHPETWRDYSTLDVVRADYLTNSFNADRFETRRDLGKIGKPVDRQEWSVSPPTVNAYYSPLHNDINFPAGVLQPPFFDPSEDDAVNYGAIGVVIGHEMTHGFDDRGRQFDKAGNLDDWWTKDDARKFETRASCIAEQYSDYTAIDDVKLNGRLTLGENTADNGGAHIAFQALQRRLQGRKLAPIDGFTPDQRFFLGFAQVWCENIRPEEARTRALTDPHSAARYRVNGVLSNMPEFRTAFACKPGDAMVRPNACRVW
ncbi:MAG TPA: M13 family metallopeptidase [Aliidongia sp.]|nr:M13 family metallopeptidase [Aliidongia sp.]